MRDREIVCKTRITSFQQLEHDGPASTALTKFIWQHQKSQLKLFSSNFQFGNRVGTQKSKLSVDHKVSITWRDQRSKWDQSEIQLTRMAFSFRSCRIMDRFTIVFSYVTLSRYFQFFYRCHSYPICSTQPKMRSSAQFIMPNLKTLRSLIRIRWTRINMRPQSCQSAFTNSFGDSIPFTHLTTWFNPRGRRVSVICNSLIFFTGSLEHIFWQLDESSSKRYVRRLRPHWGKWNWRKYCCGVLQRCRYGRQC